MFSGTGKVASLDAQITSAIAARGLKLIRQRNEFLVSNQASGDVEPWVIRAIISEKKSELDRLRSKIDAQDEFTTLLETKNSESADDMDYAAEVERCQFVLECLAGERDRATLASGIIDILLSADYRPKF